MDSVDICGGVGAFVSIIHSSHTCVRARTWSTTDTRHHAHDAQQPDARFSPQERLSSRAATDAPLASALFGAIRA